MCYISQIQDAIGGIQEGVRELTNLIARQTYRCLAAANVVALYLQGLLVST
jgi:hypothetical protein